MSNVVAINKEKTVKKARGRKFSMYVEDSKSRYLFTGVDERGKTAYFFKVQMTGLQERIFGPYGSRAMAVACFDTVLSSALESFCEVAENSRRDHCNNGMEHIALPQTLTPVATR
jgi:hypothetical protein